MLESFYGMEEEELLSMIQKLDNSLVEFLMMNDFTVEVADCNRNSASTASFKKRFFHHFNAFRIIKYLNFVHPDPFLTKNYTLLRTNIEIPLDICL